MGNDSIGNLSSSKQNVPLAELNKEKLANEPPKHEFNANEELLGLHKNKLNDIEKKIVAGEMNDLGIEVFVLETDQSQKANHEKKDVSSTALVRSEKTKASRIAVTLKEKGKRKNVFAKIKRTKSSTV